MANPLFSTDLINWYKKIGRDLPWRNTVDPYRIWLSEIILQQTRVSQGLPYYERFVEQYPTVQDLSSATEQQVLRLWQGLGYYSRGRNLHKCAVKIVEDYQGRFPETYEELQKLPGIGKYTAAAIASFAFKKVVPVVDGNVYRVISRYYGIETPINSSSAFNEFFAVVKELISSNHPDTFNQALMELGATICKPGTPNCVSCPINDGCFGRLKGLQTKFPIKKAKKQSTIIKLKYTVYRTDDKIWMRKREKGIWRGLYEFYLSTEKVLQKEEYQSLVAEEKETYGGSKLYEHKLSHKDLIVSFDIIELENDEKPLKNELNGRFYTVSELRNLPKPILIDNYLKEVIF